MSGSTKRQRTDGENTLAALSAAAAKIVESDSPGDSDETIKASAISQPEKTKLSRDNRNGQLHPLYGVQPFIAKLYQMISTCDKDHPEIAIWDDDGQTFVVKDTKAFASVIMPNYLQTKQFDSFIRNLNFYDFHKIHALPIPKNDQDPGTKKHVKYRHINFQRDQMDLVREIKRSTRKVKNATVQQEKEIDSLHKKCAALEASVKFMMEHVQKCNNTVSEMEHKIIRLESNFMYSSSRHHSTTSSDLPSIFQEEKAVTTTLVPVYPLSSSSPLQNTSQLSKPGASIASAAVVVTTDESSASSDFSINAKIGVIVPIEKQAVIPASDLRDAHNNKRFKMIEKLGSALSSSMVNLRVPPLKQGTMFTGEMGQRLF